MSLFVLFAAACSNSGLGHTTESGDSGGTTPVGLQDCPLVGTWNLTGVNCATFPYDDWYADHTQASMVIDHDPAGGCAVIATVIGDACTRTETWSFSVPAGIESDALFGGITTCDPDSCVFGAGDPEPCAVGDLAETATEAVRLELDGDELTATGLIDETAGNCPLDVITLWELQP
ncbi:MAG: hypothetical protein ABMB14_02950 [Myxococcota bacterium]